MRQEKNNPEQFSNEICQPDEVAVKSFFLGPNAENSNWLMQECVHILERWFDWRKRQNKKFGASISKKDQEVYEFVAQQKRTTDTIEQVLNRFEDEIPKFSPRYIGHMFSEISMPALLGHIITLLHNPNNISPEASRVGTQIEKEAISELAKIVGYESNNYVGHFTSGGTVANFEFLYRTRERLALWLAAGLATGEKSFTKSSGMGWKKFAELNSKLSNADFNNYYYLDSPLEAASNIFKLTGKHLKSPVLFVSKNKHYSWPKGAHYFGIGANNIQYVELDKFGRASSSDLDKKIKLAIDNDVPILGVVSVAGTTELGSIDPIYEIQSVISNYKNKFGLNIWHHIDAAYGGFFRNLVIDPIENDQLSAKSLESLRAIELSNSITLDPHKLGYVPYASGVFLCKEQNDYFQRSFSGPYIVSEDTNLGNFTLEGSRSASGAVATYLSLKSFGSAKGYSRVLGRTILVKNQFQESITKLPFKFYFPEGLDTNILCFTRVDSSKKLSQINARALEIYKRFEHSHDFWISKTTLLEKSFEPLINEFCSAYGVENDCGELLLLRLTFMNPFSISKVSKTDHVADFCKTLNDIIVSTY